jgi:hypothetical protein
MRPLFDAFRRGRARQIPGNARGAQAEAAARSAYDLAKARLRSASDNSDLVAIAENLGFVHVVAGLAGLQDVLLEVVALLGHAYRGYDVPDRDDAKTASHDQLIYAASRMERAGSLGSAAIEKTNAGTALLEKYAVTAADVEKAGQYLEFSRQHKDESSVDWGYTEFATGIYYMQRRATSVADRVEKLATARNHFEAALAIFEEHEEPLSAVAGAEYGHLLVVQFEADAEKRVADAVIANCDELPDHLRELAQNTPLLIGNMLLSNPMTAGLAETPQWLTAASEWDIDDPTASILSQAATRIENSLSSPKASDRAALDHARWWRARIRWQLDHTGAHLTDLFDAAVALQAHRDRSGFLEKGVFAWRAGRTHFSERQPPAGFVDAVVAAYVDIVTGEDDARIESFAQSYTHLIRFMACSLADQGLWEDAANILETTRLLIHGRRAILGDYAETLTPTASWVYVTHTPDASYVITCRGNEPAAGKVITAMSGRQLVQSALALGQTQMGLLTAQWASMSSELTEAAARTMADLSEARDAIIDLVPEGQDIYLVPSGIYAALPVGAALTDAAPDRYGIVATVPARRSVITEESHWPLADSNFHGVSAANAAGATPLPHAQNEVEAITHTLLPTITPPSIATFVHDATAAQFTTAATSCDALHFSGHSYSSPAEPSRSALVLTDRHFAVSDILTLDLSGLKLLTLSSCQSSSASITVMASDYIGIHSAFLYAGCRYVIGTLWPVLDLVAATFMNCFYYELATRADIGLRAVYESFQASQRWMKESTVRHIESFAAKLEPAIDLPAAFSRMPDDARPFNIERLWASFELTVRAT